METVASPLRPHLGLRPARAESAVLNTAVVAARLGSEASRALTDALTSTYHAA